MLFELQKYLSVCAVQKSRIMNVKLSTRLDQVKPSPTMEITAMAKKMKADGKDVVGFGAGEPDFDTPEFIKQAAIKSLESGFTKYTAVQGTDELRGAIVEKLETDNKLTYDVSEVIAGSGGKQVLYNLFMGLLNPEDEVLIPGPYWVSYRDIVVLAGAKAVILPSTIGEGFKISPEKLENAITDKTKAIVFNSPSNPTGVVYTKDELAAFAAVLKKYPNVVIITDDIYEKILYDGNKFCNIVMADNDLLDRTVIVNGMSKAYSMTGWRLGYAAAKNKDIIKAIVKLQGQSTSHPTSFVQTGGAAALRGDQGCVDEMLVEFAKRRQYLVEEFAQVDGVDLVTPGGAFYVFPDFTKLIETAKFKELLAKNGGDDPSKVVAGELLRNYLVAVVPGVAFGCETGFRMSYAISMEQIEKGMKRIKEFFSTLV